MLQFVIFKIYQSLKVIVLKVKLALQNDFALSFYSLTEFMINFCEIDQSSENKTSNVPSSNTVQVDGRLLDGCKDKGQFTHVFEISNNHISKMQVKDSL